MPRGSASKKRRVSEAADGEALSKKMKMDSFAGLVSGEVSQWNRYPLQKPRTASATGSGDNIAVSVTDHTEHESAMPVDPQLLNGEFDGDVSASTHPSHMFSRETVVSSIEEESGGPIDGVEASGLAMATIPRPQPCTPDRAPQLPQHEGNGVLGSPGGDGEAEEALAMCSSQPPSAKRTVNGIPTSKASTARAGSRREVSITPKGAVAEKARRGSKGSIKVESKSETGLAAVSAAAGDEVEDMASLALALQLQMQEHGLRVRSK